jgi:hypothetical protein
VLPGQAGISAPVLNWQNEPRAVVTLIIRLDGADEALTGAIRKLTGFSALHSARSLAQLRGFDPGFENRRAPSP